MAVRIGPLADSGLSAASGRRGAAAVGGEPGLSRGGAARRRRRRISVDHEAVLGTFRTAASTGPSAVRGGAAACGLPGRLQGRRCGDAPAGGAATAAASASSCRTRWPTSWRPAGWCACCSAFEQPAIPVHLLTKGRVNRAPKIEAFLGFSGQPPPEGAGRARAGCDQNSRSTKNRPAPNSAAPRSTHTGRVSTQARMIFRTVPWMPDRLAAIVPATPDESTCVVLTGRPAGRPRRSCPSRRARPRRPARRSDGPCRSSRRPSRRCASSRPSCRDPAPRRPRTSPTAA